MKDLRSSGRGLGKEVVVEPVNDDKDIDVNDEASDDDFVDMGGNSAYASGLRRSGRNKDKEVYDSDHAKTLQSGKVEKQGRKRTRETSMSEVEKKVVGDKTVIVKKQKQVNKKKQETGENSLSAVLQTRSSPRVLCNAMLQLKPNQKACLEEIGFGGMVEFKVDGIPSKLGLYVVDNFDDNKMEIKLSKGSIVLTKDMIGDMLGPERTKD
ncbi:hypothetical protein Tco_0331211 [Tanacetum coccineum]